MIWSKVLARRVSRCPKDVHFLYKILWNSLNFHFLAKSLIWRFIVSSFDPSGSWKIPLTNLLLESRQSYKLQCEVTIVELWNFPLLSCFQHVEENLCLQCHFPLALFALSSACFYFLHLIISLGQSCCCCGNLQHFHQQDRREKEDRQRSYYWQERCGQQHETSKSCLTAGILLKQKQV